MSISTVEIYNSDHTEGEIMAKKKAIKRKTIKKKPVKRKTAAKKTAKKKAKPKMACNMEKLAKDLKVMINKYLKMALEHTKYYHDAKYWTDKGINQVIKLSKELESAQRQYLKMAQQFLKKMML